MFAGILGAEVGVRQLRCFVGAVACLGKLSVFIGEDDVAGAYAAMSGALLSVAVVSIAAAESWCVLAGYVAKLDFACLLFLPQCFAV